MLAPAEARERLQKVLTDSIACALALKDILDRERQALEQRDDSLLADSASDKDASVRSLAALEERRRKIGREAGFGTDIDAMPSLAQWCDADGTILNGWQRFLGVARQCEAMNSTNGAIIRVCRQQVLAGIALLRGTEIAVDTYGIAGAKPSASTGRDLAQA